MTPATPVSEERWERVKTLFAAALEQAPSERAALIARVAAEDAWVAQEVASLLASHDPEADFLEVSAIAAATRFVVDEGDARIGQLAGPYRLRREIGRGGMGAVYLAERDDDAYRKQVAVKLIKRGMDTDAIVRRFRHERQILATLDHPNIARLLDGGTTADGLPYFVMEYIDGQPIDAYCTTHGLTIADRLRLFRQVCGAVHFAHQNLVIHRDIKPGNILITQPAPAEAGATPKLLDFGLARVLDTERATDSTLAAAAMRAMTPEYASPEQLRGETLSTLSDVYALGVLLHELITGERPYRVSSRSPDEVARSLSDQPPTPARAGHPALRGDLRTIVAMAMRPEPARRYVSAEQLGDDVRRFLARRPVLARPDRWSYRTTQFVRRNKAGVLAAALVLMSLLGGLGAAAWQARIARAERARAESRFADVRQLAGALLFELDDAIEPLPGSTPARALVVRRALEYLDRLSRSTTSADVSLQRELASAYERVGRIQGNSYYANLGNTAGAMASYRKALAIRRALAARAPNDRAVLADLAASQIGLGDAQYTVNDLAAAQQSYQRALSIRERLAAADPNDMEPRRALAESHTRLGDISGLDGYPNLGDTPGAMRHYRQALALREAVAAAVPNDSTRRLELAITLSNAGMIARTTGDLATSLTYGRRATVELERLTRRSPNNIAYRRELLGAYNTLRYALADSGLTGEAIANSRKSIPMLEALAAADPQNVDARRDLSVALNVLGRDLRQSGDAAGALATFHRALAIANELAAADPKDVERRRDVAFTTRLIGDAKLALHDGAGALAEYRRGITLETSVVTSDRDRDDLATTYAGLATALAATGATADALAAARQAADLADTVAAHSPTHMGMQARLARRLFELGTAQQRLAHARAACDAYRRSLAVWKTVRASHRVTRADADAPAEAAHAADRCRTS